MDTNSKLKNENLGESEVRYEQQTEEWEGEEGRLWQEGDQGETKTKTKTKYILVDKAIHDMYSVCSNPQLPRWW